MRSWREIRTEIEHACVFTRAAYNDYVPNPPD